MYLHRVDRLEGLRRIYIDFWNARVSDSRRRRFTIANQILRQDIPATQLCMTPGVAIRGYGPRISLYLFPCNSI